MNRTVLAIAAMSMLGLAKPAHAQTVTDERVWLSLSLQGRHGDGPWRWSFDSGLRTRGGAGTLDLLLARAGVGRDLSPLASLWAGYATSGSVPDAGGVTVEQRVFQQFLWAARRGALSASLRTRLEQRFTEGNSGVAVRLRQQLRLAHPIGASRFSLVGWDELFVHLNDTSRFPRGVDQNRAFVGVSHPAGSTRVEVGYLNQMIVAGTPDRMNHIVFGGVSASF
jgi:hypothetical protein